MIRIYDKILQSNQSTEVSLMKFYKKIDLLRVISVGSRGTQTELSYSTTIYC